MKNCPTNPTPSRHAEGGDDQVLEEIRTTPTDAQRRAQNTASVLNTLADEPINTRKLDQAIRDVTYNVEAAKYVRINPNAGAGRAAAIQRNIQRIISANDPQRLSRFLLESRRMGENILEALPIVSGRLGVDSARLNVDGIIDDAARRFRGILKEAGVTGREADELFVDGIEVGTRPWTELGNLGSNAKLRLDQQYRQWVNRVKAANVSESAFNELDVVLKNYGEAQRNARAAARAVGLDVGDVNAIGYFHREFTEDFVREIRDQRYEELRKLGLADSPTEWVTQSSKMKSRNTWDYTVEDEFNVAVALGLDDRGKRSLSVREARIKEQADKIQAYQAKLAEGSPTHNQTVLDRMMDKYGRLQQEYTDIIDEPIRRLNELLSDETKLSETLHNLDPKVLDDLVTNGYVSKLPMTSRRLYDYLLQKYELPYEALGDMLKVDPVKAHQHYTSTLRRQMGASNMVRNMVNASQEFGWGVSRRVFESDPDKYGGWLDLQSVLNNHGFNGRDMGIPVRGLFVPEEVGQQVAAMIDIATDPGKLGMVDNIIFNTLASVNRVTKQAAMTSLQFVFRNLYQSTIAGFASGANMMHYLPSLGNVVEYMRKGADGLDNTRRIYSGMTERELVLNMKLQGRLSLRGAMGEATGGAIGNARDLPANLQRRIRYMAQQAAGGQVLSAAGEGFGAIGDVSGTLIGLAMLPTAIIEDAMKLAVLKTRLGDAGVNRFAQVLSGSAPVKAESFQDAIDHLDRFFINYDDAGAFDKAMTTYAMPFWMYMSRNIPMQIRNTLRQPGRAAAYLKLYQSFNGEAQQRGENLPEGGFSQYVLDGMPLVVTVDGDDSKAYTVNTENIDAFAEIVVLLTKSGNQLASEQVEAAVDGSQRPGWLQWGLDNTHGTIKSAIALLSNEDPFTGRDLSADGEASTLGVNVPSIAGIPPGTMKFLIESNVPYVAAINRWNPAQLFGVRQVRDAHGVIVRESKESIFGVRRSDYDVRIKGDDRETNRIMRAARFMGLNVNEHDIERNMQKTHSFYQASYRELLMQAGGIKNKMERSTDPQEREALMHQYILLQANALQVKEGEEDAYFWLEARGVPVNRDANELLEMDVQEQEAFSIEEEFINDIFSGN